MALKATEKKALKARLEQERDRLLADLRGLDAEIVSLGQSQQIEAGGAGNHFADDATDIMEQEKDLALKGNLEERIRDVERALGRLADGTYGICENCGRPINPERLEALPSARLCIDCKAQADRRRGG